MRDLVKIHEFAVEYEALYSDPETRSRDVEANFDSKCFAFGFEMDCGARFMKAFSEKAFYSNEELMKNIDSIEDIDLLGSAIFSHWRYVTHWTQTDLIDTTNRPWFITAFSRLAAITEK